jgi:integration host factor subunit beta
MKRSDLVQALKEANPAMTMRDVETVIFTFFDEIAGRMAANGRVELRGFGNFSTRQHGSKNFHQPRTGETARTKPRRHLYFRASLALVARLNSARTGDD